MQKIRIGVIGLRFGQHHVRTLANMADAQLVAVADRHDHTPGGLEAFAASYGARAYRDAHRLIDDTPLDALSICTAPGGRAAIIEHAAAKGIPMFIEKPWAANMVQANQLAALCQRTHAVVMTAFSFRFHPALVKLAALLKSDLGQPWLLNGHYAFAWTPPADFWLWDPENGGGFFNENSCHLFDAVCTLLGEPRAVMAEAATHLGAPSENAAAVAIRFDGGALAALTIGGVGASGHHDFPRLEVICANGQAQLRGRNHIWEALNWSTRDRGDICTLVQSPEALGATRYSDAFQHFFDCIRLGQPPVATVADGVRSVALAMAIYESARSGRKVIL